MMRCPSAYCATSRGMSRSIMRSSTQPTRPEEFRTRYQSSMTGLGGSAPLVLPAAADALVFAAEVAGVVAPGADAGWLGADWVGAAGLAGALPPAGGAETGGIWSLPVGWPFELCDA